MSVFFQAEDGIRDIGVTGVQTCALPIWMVDSRGALAQDGRRAERLELRVPTTPSQLPAVRAMGGDLAIRMDYDLDSVEDLRLAVDEACATLSASADGHSPPTVVFETPRAGLTSEARVPVAEGT